MSFQAETLQTESISVHETATISNSGYLFLGGIGEEQYTKPQINPSVYLPTLKTYCGSSEDKGNTSRSLYFMNTNGPMQFNETLDDRKQILVKYANYVVSNAALTFYPYLYPPSITQEWSARTQTAIDLSRSRSDSNRIYKCLGKGLGEVVFMKAGDPIVSSEQGLYDYDGYLYSGTLVQLHTNQSETVVIPYQMGRGIPEYSNSSNYSPENSLTTNSFPPFGEMTPASVLAPGIEPGQSNTCFGIVLDTYTTSTQSKGGNGRRTFVYPSPEGFTESQLTTDNHDKYYNHPAPHTVPAVSFETNLTTPKTQGFLSPGPNLSGVYFAPWPRYYAYQPGDPVPILTRGITTARIGAAYNIALMTYAIRTQISATDEIWVPIQTIPLFDGERIEAGSYIYAAVKGHNIGPGEYQDIDPDDLGDNSQFVTEGILGQTPWNSFVDSTYGNYGQTGTPGLSFSNIPDTSISILQTTPDELGIERSIPGLHQANQGSIIVHPITSVSPSPAIGNAYLQSPIELSTQGFSEADVTEIKTERAALPGISGRCVLSQSNPEKAQPIGILLETIIGTGRWTYTTLAVPDSTAIEFPTELTLVTGGAVYGDPGTLGSTPLRGGSDTGKEASWVTFNEFSPYFGTITGTITETVVGGPGYLVGDILTFQDNSLTYYLTPQYKANNAAIEITDLGPPIVLELFANGSNYVTGDSTCYNLTQNSGYFQFETIANEIFPIAGGVANPVVYFQNLFRYIPGYTIIRVLLDSVVIQDQGYFNFTDYPTALDQNLNALYNGANHPVVPASYFDTLIIDYNQFAPLVNITAVAGSITTGTIIDYGAGNQVGDRILLIAGGGDDNVVFNFPGLPPGYQELIATVPNYISGIIYQAYDPTTGLDVNLTVETVSQSTLNTTTANEETVSVGYFIDTIGAIVTGDYNLWYTGGYTPNTSPWYHCNRQCLNLDVTGPTILDLARGGTNYTTATNVETYNLTANSLRIQFNVQTEILRNHITGLQPYDDPNYGVLSSRYTFGATDGTQVRILNTTTANELQNIVRLVSFDSTVNGLEISDVRLGGLYSGVPNGNIVFQTQRLDQENPTVDITVDSGRIRTVRLNRLGRGNVNGDIILILQSGTDTDNATFIFNDNMPYVDLPPYAVSTMPNHKVATDTAAWERYSDIMASATNLLDRQVLIELRPTNEQSMENITPYGVIGGSNAPPTENIYKSQSIIQ